MLSVILAHELASRFPNAGGGGIGASYPTPCAERVAPMMADAYGTTFWYAVGLVVVAFLVAITLLPKHKPEPVDDPDDALSGEAAEPVLMH